MENFSPKDLEVFLRSSKMPIIERPPLTVFSIAKQPHYENVSSNIYAFFFDSMQEHNLGELFINSLFQLISSKTSSINFNSYNLEVKTEVGTDKNGRIDILLSNSKDAIIIENKIRHHLNNDLDDYWDSTKQQNKIGIILSLIKVPQIGHNEFINITHSELMQTVIANLGAYFPNANEKYLFLLRDFYQNIINLTNPMQKEVIQFYYRNETKVKQVSEINEAFVGYIIEQVQFACESINEKLENQNPKNQRFRYYVCPENRDLMITVVFEGLFNGKKELLLLVELQNTLLKRREEIRNAFNVEESHLLHPDFYTKTGNWAHLAIETLYVKEEDILNLSEYISNAINQSPLLSIFRKVKSVLIESKLA